jgi:anti-anti-sigma factor
MAFDTHDSRQLLGVDRRAGDAPVTIVSWEPEHEGIGLTVTYELIRRQTARVTLTGELNYDLVGQTRDALLSALTRSVRWVEVDTGALEFCDSAGLEMLRQFAQRCSQRAGRVRVVSASPVGPAALPAGRRWLRSIRGDG